MTVFRCQREEEALVVRGLLESSGIGVLMTYLDPWPRLLHPSCFGVVLRVSCAEADDALRLIRDNSLGLERHR